MIKRLGLVAGILALVLVVPTAALAQSGEEDEGVLIRIGGDAVLGSGEETGLALVIRGDLTVEGTSETVVVVNGTASLEGATVETLVVVSGEAVLGDGTVVTGDVWLADSSLTRLGTSEVQGVIRRDFQSGLLIGLWILGIIIGIGLGVLAILGGMAFAAVGAETARRAGRAIRESFGQVVIAGLVFWIALPIVGGFLFVTVIGIPTALAIWFVVLPVVGFLGYLVTGIWIGKLILSREDDRGKPYLAAFLGIVILVVAGIIPGLGGLIGTLAGLLGGSALALLMWNSFRKPTGETYEPETGSAEEAPPSTD
ncbi:MAG: hypothetical protein ACE5MI_01815 [Acidimicrobiia bacterium]